MYFVKYMSCCITVCFSVWSFNCFVTPSAIITHGVNCAHQRCLPLKWMGDEFDYYFIMIWYRCYATQRETFDSYNLPIIERLVWIGFSRFSEKTMGRQAL